MCYRYLLLLILIYFSNADQCKINNRTEYFKKKGKKRKENENFCLSKI